MRCTNSRLIRLFLFVGCLAWTGSVVAQPGALDTSFGDGGTAAVSSPDPAAFGFAYGYDVVETADRRLIVAGSVEVKNLDGEVSGRAVALAKLTEDGLLDPDFGTGGLVTHDISPGFFDQLFDIALLPDGKIIACGTAFHNQQDILLARFHADGRLDRRFGDNGVVVTHIQEGENAFSLAVQENGRIVIAGATKATSDNRFDFVVARYRSSGKLDRKFADGGMFIDDFGFGDATARKVMVQADGKIVVAGDAGEPAPPYPREMVALRLRGNGSLDRRFGEGGLVVIDFTGKRDFTSALAIDDSGRILVGGQAENGEANNWDIAITRLKTNGRFDRTFGDRGRRLIDLQSKTEAASGLQLEKRGKILVGGWVASAEGTACNGQGRDTHCDLAVMRLRNNGDLDPNFGVGGWQTTDVNGHWDRNFGMIIDSRRRIVLAGTTTTGAPNNFPIAEDSAMLVARFFTRRAH